MGKKVTDETERQGILVLRTLVTRERLNILTGTFTDLTS